MLSPTPLLMFLAQGGDEQPPEDDVFFLNAQEKLVMSLKNLADNLRQSRCVGSSHGWLLLLDEQANPYLLNPFSGDRIQLPPKHKFAFLISVSMAKYYYNGQEFLAAVDFRDGKSLVTNHYMSMKELQKLLVYKAVLSAEPTQLKKKSSSWVAAICGSKHELYYCKQEDSAWTALEAADNGPYVDIIFHRTKLYALGNVGSVEIWDFSRETIGKEIKIEPSISPARIREPWEYGDNPYYTRWYLVKSGGDLLFVHRFIGEFVNYDGELLSEGDLLTKESTHPLVCPYRTLLFRLYRLNLDLNRWEEVESVGDRALFLGGNQSASVSVKEYPECEKNSIYFSDDDWLSMDLDYLYGGHDLGVFSLEDRKVKPIYPCDSGKIDPSPFWIVPSQGH